VSARERVSHLGDFTLERGVLRLCALAVPLGVASAVCALALLRLIGLITNLVFYGRLATSLVAPGVGRHSPLLILLAPALGGLVVGLMARFGSERIRGHGMPEAIEAILTRGSRIAARGTAEANLGGDQHWQRWAIRCGGPDHHDGRGRGLGARAVSAHERR
jgi:H+/Cl- antiporter ClcA